jgi:hypothetical protein
MSAFLKNFSFLSLILVIVFSGSVIAQDDANQPSRLERAKALLGRAVDSAKGIVQENENALTAESIEKYRQQLNGVAKLAKLSGNESLESITNFLGETLGQMSEAGLDVNSYATWANETYSALKEQGLTSASSAYQWWGDEMKKASSWEYRILEVPLDKDELQAKLTEIGSDGWECVGPTVSNDRQLLIFKRRGISVLSNIPIERSLLILKLLQK